MARLGPRLSFGLVSVAVHAGLMGALSEETLSASRAVDAGAHEVVLEVRESRSGDGVSELPPREPERVEVQPGGPTSRANLDRAGPRARGGEGRAREPVVLLLPNASPVTLLDTFMNNAQVNQTQRIRTAHDRATLEKRRATPNPDQEVFLASGEGPVAQRLPVGESVPAAGAPTRERTAAKRRPDEAAKRRANEAGAEQQPTEAARTEQGSHRSRSQERAVAAGIHRGRGERQQQRAAVQLARPTVDQGPAATPARSHEARVRDNDSTELLSAEAQRSWVESSVVAPEQRGVGRGGADALGTPGRGPRPGRGARARPHRPGSGHQGALDTRDSRYIRWFTRQRARVAQRVEFPTERALAKDQGTSLFRVVLRRDGRLRGMPSLVRSSGHGDFDRAAREAIQAALPFAPLPQELAPDRDTVAILIPIEFFNPMVQ